LETEEEFAFDIQIQPPILKLQILRVKRGFEQRSKRMAAWNRARAKAVSNFEKERNTRTRKFSR